MRIVTITLFTVLFVGICQAQVDKKDDGNYSIPTDKTKNDTIKNKKNGHYFFELVANNEATSIKNQNRTGTCWSFSSLSYFESELIRMGKGKVELSPMYVVRNAYIGKAENYLRMYGNFNFGEGGAFHDIPW